MRRLITAILSVTAAVFGWLILGHTIRPLWKFQMGLNELSWLAGFTGLAAMVRGWRERNFLNVILGSYGFVAALWPVFWIPHTLITMENEMQKGLGEAYASKIPPAMWPRLSRFHWSLLNALGRRNYSSQASISRDIAYSKPGIRPLKLDVYEPLVRPAQGDLYPAIIVLHPGGWHQYDKSQHFAPHNRYLASQGYVVFDVQYRLSQEATWPAPLDDIVCAIEWVRQHAANYRIDTEKIALMGRSAGGHLALRAAYDDRTHVHSVVALYAPTDLRLWHTSEEESSVTKIMGGSVAAASENYADASPIELVRDGLPNTLLITGMLDSIVAPAHAAALSNRLAATSTTSVTLHVPWARHGFDAIMPGLGAQVVQYNIDRFLAWSFYRD